MRAEFFVVVAAVAASILTVRVWERTADRPAAAAEAAVEMRSPGAYETSADDSAPTAASDGWSREVRVQASHDHQFYIVAGVNRRAAEFLVDTGAGYVALRDSDARAAGVYTVWTDYTIPVRTANGETKAALVTIDEIQIEGILIRDVRAFVLPDEQLGVNLLGMSFLSRLESVEARAGELVLRG